MRGLSDLFGQPQQGHAVVVAAALEGQDHRPLRSLRAAQPSTPRAHPKNARSMSFLKTSTMSTRMKAIPT